MKKDDITIPINNNTKIRSPTSPSASSSSCTRRRPWRYSQTGIAVIAVLSLVFSTTAWLSLVFSDTTSRCWHRFKDCERNPYKSFPWHHHKPPPPPPPPLISSSTFMNNTNQIQEKKEGDKEELSLKYIVFGIAGSSQLWNKRKEFVKLWWRPNDMRGHVWLDEKLVHKKNGGSDDDDRNWHLVSRRLCCRVNQTNDDHLRLLVGQCRKGGLGFFVDSV